MPNYQRRRRLLGALLVFVTSFAFSNWSGYYGLLIVPPMWESGLFAVVMTVISLRAWVLVTRYMR